MDRTLAAHPGSDSGQRHRRPGPKELNWRRGGERMRSHSRPATFLKSLLPFSQLVMAAALIAGVCGLASDIHANVLTFQFSTPVVIPETGQFQTRVPSAAAPEIATINAVRIALSHEWLGDVTLRVLSPSGTALTLFNRVGALPEGSSAILGTYASSDSDSSVFTLTPQQYEFAAVGTDFPAEAQLAVETLLPPTLPSDEVYAAASWLQGPLPAGTWQLEVSDAEDLSGGRVISAEIDYTPVGPVGTETVVLNWNPPADIAYGTPLGSGQLSATATAGGIPVSGVFVYTPRLGTVLPAGTGQSLSVQFTPNDTARFAGATTSVTINVSRAPLTARANAATKIYGAPLPTLSVSYSGFVNGDTETRLSSPVFVSTPATAASPVGNYPINVSGGESPNYALTLFAGTLTVSKAPLTVTADDKVKPYGAALPSFTATYSGFVNGDTPASLTQPVTFTTTAAPGSPVGTYSIRANGGSSPNYAFTLNPGVLTVNQALLTVVADNKAVPYGAALPAFTATYSGFVNGDTPARLTQPVTFTTTAKTNSPAGVYAITPTGGVSPNYRLQLIPGALTVTKRALSITAEDKTKLFGAALPIFTASYAGFVNGDTASSLPTPVTFSTTATAGSRVGVYPITPLATESPNYTVVLKSGFLTVTKAPLTVTADDKVKVYGAALPDFTARYAGFVNGDTSFSLAQSLTFGTTASVNSPAGTYPITLTGGASSNYNVTFKPGTLTVSKAPLTVTADDKTKVYGAAVPVFTVNYRGFVQGDTATSLSQTVTVRSTATAESPAGTYPILLSGGATANYSLVLNNGTLTVTKAPLIVTADNKVKVYGAALPPFSVTYSGLIKGDTLTSLTEPFAFETTATSASPVGNYPITIRGGASSNYSFVLNPGTLTVARAPLTVTADPKTKTYGAALPVFTATYTGFVNGDTAASLTQPVTFGTTATAASPVGAYQIRASGGASPNYSLVLNNGVLNITPAPLTIVADDKSKLAGAPLPVLTATCTGFVNGDTLASLAQPVKLITTATAASPLGTYPIYATGAFSPNYAIAFSNGVLKVIDSQMPPALNPTRMVFGTDGSLRLSVEANPGARVRLESSEDLRTWSPVGFQTSADGQCEFHLENGAESNLRFFRAVTVE